MATTSDDRVLLRSWLATHNNLMPGNGEPCAHAQWIGDHYTGKCGSPSEWIVHYGSPLGARAHCERHTVKVIKAWHGLEKLRISREAAS